MKTWRHFALLVIAVASAALLFTAVKPPKFETSLEALAGENAISLPDPVRRSVSSRVQALAASKDFGAALALAERFVLSLDAEFAKTLRLRVNAAAFPETLAFYGERSGSFLSERDSRAAGDGTLYDSVLERLASPAPSLFAFKADPCRFSDDFVKTLPQGFGKWRVRNDVLSASKDGVDYVLVSFSLPESAAFDIGKLPEVLAPVVETCRRLNAESAGARLSLCGVPVHTLETAGKCERQIGVLSAFSLTFILALAFLVFRSLRGLGIVAVNLTVSAAAGFAAVDLAFDRIHLLALVFGTTLIGLTVDYSFHRLLSAGGTGSRAVKANLGKSYLTTVISFLPLVFSGAGVLVQAAVFLVSGLTASFLYSVFLTGPLEKRPAAFPGAGLFGAKAGARPGWGAFPWAVGAFSAIAVLFADFRTEPRDLHAPSRELAAAESTVAELSGIGPDSVTAVVAGGDLEEILAEEERLLPGFFGISRFVPSFGRREENHRKIKTFHGRFGGDLAGLLGLKELPEPKPPRRLERRDVPGALAGQFLFDGADGRLMSLVPGVPKALAEKAAANGETGIGFYSPSAMLAEVLDGYARTALRLLSAAFLLLLAVLFVFYRVRAFLVVLPSALAVVAVFAFVTVSGRNVNLFHVLASFMLVGISLDYTIFLAGGFRHGWTSVACSFLTSMAGFGALAFVSFPVVSSLGFTLGAGLPVAFFTACALFRPGSGSGELAATGLGLETAWLIYRIAGKRALDCVVWLVALSMWIFSAKARRAAGSFRRIVNFALSLGDKMVVLSMGRGQPRITLDDSGDAESFVADVAARKGVVAISSHLGNIETLAAYGDCATKFHVFMAISITGVFRAFKERHARRSMIEVHPTEGFSMAELFLGDKIVSAGDVVLIAGDRGGGRVRPMPFLGGMRNFPEGAFRFAGHLERPVYFVASLRVPGGYRFFAKRLAPGNLLGDYVRELERLVKQYPEQWYQWEDGENDG